MVIVDISSELRYGYESNRHDCNEMILDIIDTIKAEGVIRILDERSLRHIIKEYVDVGAAITMITAALFESQSFDRVADEINFQVSELLQELYAMVEYDDESGRISFVERQLDKAIKIDYIATLEHLEYVMADKLLDWAVDMVEDRAKIITSINNYIRGELPDYVLGSEMSAEFNLRERVLFLRGVYVRS